MRLLLFLLLFLSALPADAQTEEAFASRLSTAALDGDVTTVSGLVGAHRLLVKPVVRSLVRDAARAGIRRDHDGFNRSKEAAGQIAKLFSNQYGEDSLQKMVDDLGRWSETNLGEKLRADSLLAAGIELRAEDDSREEAHRLFREAESIYRALDDTPGLAEVLGQIGYVHFWLDRAQYLPLNLEALEARRAADDWQLVGNSLYDIGLAHRGAGDYAAALDYFLEGEQLRRAIGDSVKLAKMLPNMGKTYELSGDLIRAQEYYLSGADMYLAVGDTSWWITQRNNIALILTDRQRHSEALAVLQNLARDMERIDDPNVRARVLLATGIVNRRLGDYQGAIENYREVIRISEEHGFDAHLARAQNNIAVVFIFMHRPDRALPYLERALAAMPEEDTSGRADILLSLSSAHFRLANYAESSEYAELARAVVADPVRKGKVLKLVADTKLRSGNPAGAVAGYQEMRALAVQLSRPDIESDALFGLGEAAERQDRPGEALAFYEQAASTLEAERGLLRTEEDKAGYLSQTRYLYEDIVHFLTEQAVGSGEGEFGERAFEFAERGKARAFLDQMTEALAGVEEGVDPEFRSDLDVLAQNMVYLRGELASIDPAAEAEKEAELKDLVGQMEGEYDRVQREMRDANPRFAAIQYPDPVGISELQADVLRDGEVLLQYALGDSSSTLWAVTRDLVEVYRLPVRSDIEVQIDLLRFALANPDPASTAGFRGPARRLYETLVGPAGHLVASAQELIVVPDGALNYVPFEALLTADAEADDYTSLPYLLRSAPVSYVQSASVLRQLRSESLAVASMDLLAVGDPAFASTDALGTLRGATLARLPFTGAEVSSIASLFDPDATEVLLGEDATEERVRAALEAHRYRFVHFATHGLVDDDRPDFSALALAGSGPGALLQASEIFNLSVKADLVVLSACETGLGQLIKGEGMVGLTRAFMYAGTPSVLVSLWSVSDESTSSLMQHVYRAIVQDKAAKSQALRSAKLALLEDTATAHPFHWAPFVLIGRAD
jgi:CHAT domain-containing protein